MRKILFLLAVAAIGLLIFCQVAGADTIHLKNGRKLKGKIIEETDSSVTIEVKGGTLTISRRQIEKIEKEKTKKDIYKERAQKLDPKDAKGHFELAMWCKDNNLQEEMKQEIEKVLEIDPNHSKAHKELGHQWHDGKWLTPDEYAKATGLVKHNGKWITKEEKAKLQKEEAGQKKLLGKTERYHNKAKGFSIEFPKAWKKKEKVAGTEVLALSPLEGVADIFAENVVVGIEQLPLAVSLKQYYQLTLKNTPPLLKDFKLLKSGNATINQRDAKWFTFSHKLEGIKSKALAYMLVRDLRAYVIICTATPNTFAKYKPKFEAIANTFKLE